MQPCILIKTTSLTSSHMNPSINTFYAFLPSKTQQGFHLGNCCIQKPHAAAAAGGGLDNPPPSASGPLAAPQTSAQGIGGLGSWRARTRAGYCAKPSPACARLLLFSLITWEGYPTIRPLSFRPRSFRPGHFVPWSFRTRSFRPRSFRPLVISSPGHFVPSCHIIQFNSTCVK
jgi:hypothetical protein